MRIFFTKTLAYLLVLQCLTANAQNEWQLARSPLSTPWTTEVSPENAWPEYPRPQLVREKWMNLNGAWNFQLIEQKTEAVAKSGKILVPFPVESALSGIGRRVKPGQLMVYNRSFTLPADWKGQRILLHFGAVDWKTEVFVNDKKVGEHEGGYDAFSFDITEFLRAGNAAQQLTVQVTDPTDTGGQPIGKQRLDPSGIFYTSVSGIWQTVWLEPVPRTYIKSYRVEPDVDKTRIVLRVELAGDGANFAKVTARILDKGVKLSESTGKGNTPHMMRIRKNARLWTLDEPYLYDLEISLGGKKADVIRGYFGLRKISMEKDANGVNRLMLNNEFVFQNGVLDQGYWPDGLYTPPSEAAMLYDLESMKKMGFNMLRKHVKVEPARWYHLCDKLGILVWQDMPSASNESSADRRQFKYELKKMVDGLFNHPSVVMWVPFNEAWGQHDTEFYVERLKEWDPTRPVINASGWTDMGVGDVLDIHAYPGPAAPERQPDRATVLGEFGGLGLNIRGHQWTDEGWGYQLIESPIELLDRYEDLRRDLYPLIGEGGLSAAVYTQVSDIETENNGLLTYDRQLPKLDPGLVAKANAGYLPPKPKRTARIFTKKRYVTLETPMPGAEMWYTLDGLNPDAEWKKYVEPFSIKKTGTVHCKAVWKEGKESRIRSYSFQKTKALKSKVPKDLPTGARLKIYEGSWEKLPDFAELTPAKELTVSELTLDSVKMEQHYALLLEGWIEVNETAAYTFGVSSDDGSQLYVAGQLVVENDGLHGMRKMEGAVPLKKGKHPIRLEFFQNEGGQGLEVWMEEIDGERRVLSFK